MTSLNTFLILFILAKLVCLYFCFKMIKVSKKGQEQESFSQEDVKQLKKRVEHLRIKNQQLQDEIISSKNDF
ncbi:hypothetical protein ACJ2A9_02290 [Anaerobacillus sp. MEB173]|uniref:hypothetical protein n=1 Tax=Anaerobacillus sp. MEB173 TaxID=3383345 RepID=UPI003F8FC388